MRLRRSGLDAEARDRVGIRPGERVISWGVGDKADPDGSLIVATDAALYEQRSRQRIEWQRVTKGTWEQPEAASVVVDLACWCRRGRRQTARAHVRIDGVAHARGRHIAENPGIGDDALALQVTRDRRKPGTALHREFRIAGKRTGIAIARHGVVIDRDRAEAAQHQQRHHEVEEDDDRALGLVGPRLRLGHALGPQRLLGGLDRRRSAFRR